MPSQRPRAITAAILATAAALTLNACGISADYLGKSFPPTTNAKIYYFEHDIEQPYEIMGTARLEASSATPVPELEAELLNHTMANGADAALIRSLNYIIVGQSGSFSADRFANDDDFVSGSTRSTITRNKVLTADLIKYIASP